MLEGIEESAAHGWLTLLEAPFSRDPAEREQLAASALTIARRFGDVDLEIEALALLGEAQSSAARSAEGMRLLDEAMAAVTAGRFATIRPRRDLLPAAERMRGGTRRAPRDGLAVDGRSLRRLDRLRAADLPDPLRRDPRRARPLGRGRGRAARPRSRLRPRLPRRRHVRRPAPRRPARAPGPRRGGRALLEGGEWHPTARRLAATIALARGDAALASELGELCAEGSALADPTWRRRWSC